MSIRAYLKNIIGEKSESPEHFVNTGTAGTEIFSGSYQEEYLQKFQTMPDGIGIFDEMRRSDYQIQMPIIAANWGIESVDETSEEKEIADFVRYCLFEDMGYPDGSKSKSFREFLREALSCIEFGYSLFEPVYKVEMAHPIWGNYIGLKDIAFRSQKTI